MTSDVTCLDTIQLGAIIFGSIFGTLALCIFFAFGFLYFATKRQYKFGEKIPWLDKLMPLNNCNEKITKKSFQHGKVYCETTKIDKGKVSCEKQQWNENIKEGKELGDSMEEISLSDDATFQAKKNLANETENVKVEPLTKTPSLPSQSPPASEYECGGAVNEETVNNTKQINSVNVKQSVISETNVQNNNNLDETKENNCNSLQRENRKEPNLKVNDYTDKSVNDKIMVLDNNSISVLSQEQCGVLEANRRRLEAERQQLQQLGII